MCPKLPSFHSFFLQNTTHLNPYYPKRKPCNLRLSCHFHSFFLQNTTVTYALKIVVFPKRVFRKFFEKSCSWLLPIQKVLRQLTMQSLRSVRRHNLLVNRINTFVIIHSEGLQIIRLNHKRSIAIFIGNPFTEILHCLDK